jgi:RNA polymerase sigma-70 factor, ECF subfamily
MSLSVDVCLGDCERYRDYLRVLARQALPQGVREKVDESDIVQDTLLQACRDHAKFRGRSQEEFRAWLRSILKRKLCDVYRAFHRQKRDVARESGIVEILEHSSCRIEHSSLVSQTTPSDEALLHEQVCHVANSLQQLPPQQREAVELKYLQELSFSEVASRMGLTRDQVAGLIRRGIKHLRELNVVFS